MQRRRVLIGKIGLDGHDRGAKVVARALRDAGYEVIYTGLHQTVDAVTRTASDEDVDAVGISILSGAHLTLLPALRKALNEGGLEDVPLFCGGIIPRSDMDDLSTGGVEAVFPPGTPTTTIIDWLGERLSG